MSGDPESVIRVSGQAGVRARVYRAMEPTAGERLSWTNRCVISLTLASVLVAILDSEPLIRTQAEPWFMRLEMLFSGLFTLEYLARLWSAGAATRWHGLRGRVRWMFTPSAIADLLALLPGYLVLAGTEGFLLRLVRLLRVLRIVRLGRFSVALSLMGEAFRARRHELLLSVASVLVVLLVTSTLLHLVEARVQPETFGSIPRAMWWSVVTLTTVGYGDVYPVTWIGQLLAGATAIAGIGLIAMPTGILAAAFADAFAGHRRRVEAAAARVRDRPGLPPAVFPPLADQEVTPGNRT